MPPLFWVMTPVFWVMTLFLVRVMETPGTLKSQVFFLGAQSDRAGDSGEDIQKQAILLADDAGQKGKREVTFRRFG